MMMMIRKFLDMASQISMLIFFKKFKAKVCDNCNIIGIQYSNTLSFVFNMNYLLC